MPDPTRSPRRRRSAALPLSLLALALLQAQGAAGQSAPPSAWDAPLPLAPPPKLQQTPQLFETITPDERRQLPSFIEGDRISGQPDREVSVEGNAVLRRGDTVVRADKLEYDQANDTARASGHVRVNQAGNEYAGPRLQLKVETFEGYFDSVRYRLLASGAEGDAARIDFLDQNRSVAIDASYTTCRREDLPGWMPAWVLTAKQIRTDTESNVGEADGAQLTVFGLPTPPLPTLSFPLSNQRKTGLLPPVIGLDNVNGLEYSQPWYWNIAPNRDATITPTIMSKRGIDLSGEFRYLEERYKGDVRLDLMPGDQLRNRTRWGIWSHHEQKLDGAWLGLDALNARLNINRVSDDDYWRDFTRTTSLTQRLLVSDGALDWNKGNWSGTVRTLSYQTLQYAPAPIVPPYDKLPQITANYNRYDWGGFDFALNTDYTRFRADPAVQKQPNGERAFARAEISRPFASPGAYITPKLQLNATAYQFDAPLANGASSDTRVLPTFSLDSGLVFERDATILGRALRQTLEPRAFYVYTPYRDQSQLPNYDSALNDISFATVFSENEFSGNDRISATNALTVGVSSKFFDADSGAELARLGIAQRIRFADQRVTLPGGVPATRGDSDLLLGAQIHWTPKWSLDTNFAYNPDAKRTESSAVTATYNPGPYRTVSASYRYQREVPGLAPTPSESIDIGWQWPLNDLWGDKGKNLGPGRGQGGGRWYAVGRLNYSLRDRALTDSIIGLEYDGCCYIARVVLERLTTGQVTANKRIMFQLEFVGFSSIGTSPLRTLQLNVPRYTPLRQRTEAPSRFTNYN